jgi:hypothetical protein
MRSENEVRLKLSYWHGAFDTLNIPENARADKLNREKIIAQTWLNALDWMLGESDEKPERLYAPDDRKP